MPKFTVEFAKEWTEHGTATIEAEDMDEARTIAEEMWIFGEPRNDREMALWRAVAPIAEWIPEGMVHRIPNN